MKGKAQTFVDQLVDQHGGFYAQTVKIVGICYAASKTMQSRAQLNADSNDIVEQFGIVSGDAYILCAAMCNKIGDKPVDGLTMVNDAKTLAEIGHAEFAQLQKLNEAQKGTIN